MSDPHDVARYIFVNDENELRSGWRVLLFFITLFVVATLLAVLGRVLATLFTSIAFVFIIPPGPDYSGSPAEVVHLCVSTAMNLLAAVLGDAEGIDPEGIVGEIGRGQIGIPLRERAVPVLHDLPDGGDICGITRSWRAHLPVLASVADSLAQTGAIS